MKRKLASLLFFVTFAVACSDFFKRDVVELPGGGGTTKPVEIPPLPEKPVLDPAACEYGQVESTDSRRVFIWNTATQEICPRVRDFRHYVTQLRVTAQQICLGGGSEEDLRYFWSRIIGNFEYLIANPFGPLQAEMKALAMEIYSWPNYNPHTLNVEYIRAGEEGEEYVMDLIPERKGLGAIEQLVYSADPQLRPRPFDELREEEKAFNSLSLEERRARRCQLMEAFIGDLAARTELLYNAWASTGEGYPRRLLERMQAGETQAVLNELSDGLYFFERVKDFKLGLPLGLTPRCLDEKCPDDVELWYSGQSGAALRANVNAFRHAMMGSDETPGFVALLEEVGRDDLASRFKDLFAQLEEAMAEVEVAGSVRDQVIAADKTTCLTPETTEPICKLYGAITRIMTIYKSDFLSALNLQPPIDETDRD